MRVDVQASENWRRKYDMARAENVQLQEKIDLLQRHIETLAERIRLGAAQRFGASSEQSQTLLGGEQLYLFNEAEAIADVALLEPEPPKERKHHPKQKGKRELDFDKLPREQKTYELPENERVCPCCGKAMHACGHSVVRREIEFRPAKYVGVEHVETLYSCRDCERNNDHTPLLKSPLPAPVIPGSGISSASLIAHILHCKYVLALPLHRQEQELERLGIPISRQTMANWVIKTSELYFAPLFKILRQELLRNQILHADETTMQVLREDGRKAKDKSYVWLYRTSGDTRRPVVLYDYKPSRAAACAVHFLQGYEGYLHTDGYEAYHSQHIPREITVVGCWAHMRRKFTDTLKALEKDIRSKAPAATGLAYCDKLFALERIFCKQGLTDDERHAARLQKSKPVANSFFAWAKKEYAVLLEHDSNYGKALTYAVNQESWLLGIFRDGRLELSNNRIERSVRPFAVGRKNWLFCNSTSGAHATATMYSIVETAKANGLKPYEYLKFLLENLSQGVLPQECVPWGDIAQMMCR
jgi:transposase